MKFTRVFLEAIGYELPQHIVTSSWIEEQLAPLYRKLHLQPGQLEALTGIRERRWWGHNHINAVEAAKAAKKALAETDIPVEDIGAVVYGGVCRDNYEPATACHVAAELKVRAETAICDVSNACLGAMNGIIDIANRIELGQIKAGIVVACETAREITQIMIQRMLEEGTMEFFKQALATMTGGSGACGIVLSDGSYGHKGPRLAGGVTLGAPEHHLMCRWGADQRVPARAPQMMETNAIGMLRHGGDLIRRVGEAFWRELNWSSDQLDKIISHQVASANRDAILNNLGLTLEKDFSTFQFLGNMGTVSLPVTAAIAMERGILEKNQKVGFIGIGSGLNSMMLGWDW
ncbi:MAG: 3-oxoacyl-ACP synthase III [Candidatus Riflebacteria bacterium HGW-Riflebacteria-2]|jgi:3-oxoacyl-[acyl-carrier-protein] synthase-3|nr:MAG: 3-oxoacyl-ACP synthase III [Candidatus Riflebacteria bacterium HGW-Riflebacteria-2]